MGEVWAKCGVFKKELIDRDIPFLWNEQDPNLSPKQEDKDETNEQENATIYAVYAG